MQSLFSLATTEGRSTSHHVEAVIDEHLEHFQQSHGSGLAIDECDGVDAEGVLHRRHLVQLLEDGLGIEAVLDLDDEIESVGLHVGQVRDLGDPGDLLGLDRILDLCDDLLRPDHVRKLADDDALAAR